MFTEDNLAAAEIARIFGSELLNIQEKARTDAGDQPKILKIHPKQFLQNSTHEQTGHELNMIKRLQLEAEATHPMPPPIEPIKAPIQVNSANKQIQDSVSTNFDHSELKNLNLNLSRIATILEKSFELFSNISNQK